MLLFYKIMSRQYLAETWLDPRQEFRPSPIQGIGSFACAPIRQGEVVEIIGGVIMTEAEFEIFRQAQSQFNAIQIAENLHLVERPEVTAQRGGGSLNHACDSNLWLADEVTIIARRDIVVGEELTVDYALFSGEAKAILDQDCQCKAAVCRHVITGDDWRLLAVQQCYYPHFSPFLNARIDRLKQR